MPLGEYWFDTIHLIYASPCVCIPLPVLEFIFHEAIWEKYLLMDKLQSLLTPEESLEFMLQWPVYLSQFLIVDTHQREKLSSKDLIQILFETQFSCWPTHAYQVSE